MTNPEIKMVKYEDLLIIKKLVYYLRGFGMWDFTEWLAFDKDSNKPFNGIAQRSENEVIERHTFEDGIITETYIHGKYTHRRSKFKKDGGVDYFDEFYKTGELRTRTKVKDEIDEEYYATHFRFQGTSGSMANLMLHQKRSSHFLSREEFYETGELKSTANYDSINLLHGSYRTYFKSGELSIKKNYEDHRIHGLCEYFYKNGLLRKSHTFKEGQKDGGQLFFDTEGNLERAEIWENGHRKSLKNHAEESGNE